MNREWYTDREWERIVGWGKVPKEYQKPEYIHEVFDYKKKNPHESWDMFLVRKLRITFSLTRLSTGIPEFDNLNETLY